MDDTAPQRGRNEIANKSTIRDLDISPHEAVLQNSNNPGRRFPIAGLGLCPLAQTPGGDSR